MGRANRKRRMSRRQRRRRRLLIWIPILITIGIFWPIATAIPTGPATATEPVTINEYVADYVVRPDGGLSATEVIKAQFPSGRHGIFRFWDRVDPRDAGLRYDTRIVGVTIDGRAEQYTSYSEGAGRYLVAKIGNPDVTLTAGIHTYVIRYETSNTIVAASGPLPEFQSTEGTPNPAGESAFWWNVVANGWRMPIARASITLHLPDAALSVQCSAATRPAGADVSEGPCRIGGAGTRDVTLAADNIPPMGGVTTRATMLPPPPPTTRTPWPWILDPVLGTSASSAAWVLGLAVVAALVGLALASATREREPGLPVCNAPPDGLGPVQTVFACDEDIGEHDIAATLFQLGNEGLIQLATKSRSWTATATDAVTPDRLLQLDPVARATVDGLGLGEAGASFKASGGRIAGERLADTHSANRKACAAWARAGRLTRPSIIGWVGRILWIVAVFVAGVGFTGRFTPTAWSLVPLALVGAGFPVLRRGATRRRTGAGRDVWSRAGGFRRMLSTPSSELRFDFAARKDLFLPFLPYAIAFGSAKEWAAKFEVETGEDAPMPSWLTGVATGARQTGLLTLTGSFESTVRSTIGAYQSASSGSSGSSGGGGSVGSGGGGGGGGSW